MKPEIQQMLAEAYELEGLLLLAENRGEETSDLIYETIKEKIDNLHALLQRKLRNGNEYASEPIGVTGLDLMHTVTEVDPRAFDGEDIAPFEPTHPCADEQIFESESELEGMPLFADGKRPKPKSKKPRLRKRPPTTAWRWRTNATKKHPTSSKPKRNRPSCRKTRQLQAIPKRRRRAFRRGMGG